MSDLFTREEQSERNARLAASVTSYGVGTKSYNGSTEARESKRQQAEATERYAAQERKEVVLDMSWHTCRCDGRPDPHPVHPRREFINFKPWFRWKYLVERARL